MKPTLLEMLAEEPDDLRRRNRAREYLQARILLALQDAGAFATWAFVGGTALRFLYGLPRYSEDLGFSLMRADQDARFKTTLSSACNDLRAEGYEVDLKLRSGKAVASSLIKFRGLLHELHLSPTPEELINVRVEIDVRPPAGARARTRIVRRFTMLNIQHHDEASLFAGKLHAVLSRPYTKGRDLFDLAWYLADPQWPAPNLELLNTALTQTGWSGTPATSENWRTLVADKLKTVDWSRAVQDVSPFLERRQDVNLVSESSLHQLLGV